MHIQVLRLNTKSLRHIHAHRRTDKIVLKVVIVGSEENATEYDLPFDLGPGKVLILLCAERSNASHKAYTHCKSISPRGHEEVVQQFRKDHAVRSCQKINAR